MFFVWGLVQSVFYPPVYSVQSPIRPVIYVRQREAGVGAEAETLPLREANGPRVGVGGMSP